MVKTKTIKLIILEFLQWMAFTSVVFTTAQKLATNNEYWLIIAGSIGYVAGITLLLWIPVKLAVQWLNFVSFYEEKWCPSKAVYIFAGALPSLIMIVVGFSLDPDKDFDSVCAELLIIMLLVVDVTEKMKHFHLRVTEDEDEVVAGISGNGRKALNSTSGFSRKSSSVSLFVRQGSNWLSWVDHRPKDLMEYLLDAYDVRLVLSLVNEIDYISGWHYPIYSLSLVAMFSFILTKKSPYKPVISLALLEIPFFFLRLSIMCANGYITNVLFLLKNFFVTAIYIYFNVIRRKIFKHSESQIATINTVDELVTNQINQDRYRPTYYGNQNSDDFRTRSRDDTFDEDYPNQPRAYYENNHPDIHRDDDHNLNLNSYAQYAHHDSNHEEHYNTAMSETSQEYHEEDHHDYDMSASNNFHEISHVEDITVHQQAAEDVNQQPYHEEKNIPFHQVKRISRKSTRRSIMKNDVFSSPQNKEDTPIKNETLREEETIAQEYPYATIEKRSVKRSAPSPPPPVKGSSSNEFKKEEDKTNISSSEDMDNSDYPLPDPPVDATLPFPSAPSNSSALQEELRSPTIEYQVGPHKISVRNNRLTPHLASQIAKEARNKLKDDLSQDDHL